MEELLTYILYIHILCGTASLVLFWIPAFTLKKRGVHTRYGKIYYLLMVCVVITAVILSVKNFVIGETSQALFLGFLAFLSFYPMWHGRAVIHNKVKKNKGFNRIFISMGLFLVLFGIFLIIYGLFYAGDNVNILMLFFGFLGFTSLPDLIRYFKHGRHGFWYQQHYRGMIISGIGAYTAFLSFGGRHLLAGIFTGTWQILPWIAPTVIGVTALRLLNRYYRRTGVIKEVP